jgi:hypothetical protein
VHRSSPSIASLAAALAKAQAELVNPEKSLTATIASGHRGGPEQRFRYAPLSSGLDIVRKTLGQHEIATGIRPPAWSISPPSWRMLRGNGSPRTGRSAPLPIPPPRVGWGRR